MAYSSKAVELLASCPVTVAPESFALASFVKQDWKSLRLNFPFGSLQTEFFTLVVDSHEITVILDEQTLKSIKFADAKPRIVVTGHRILTFETPLDFELVGFMAEISRILASAKVSILPISAFSRDHLMIKQTDLVKTREALYPYVRSFTVSAPGGGFEQKRLPHGLEE